MKNSEIKIKVTVDDKNIPQKIEWQAEGSGVEGVKPAKSLMITLWDAPETGTLRIDLWTKDMMVEEMRRFFYETMSSMADTYERATNEKETAGSIREFATRFGKETKVLK